MKRKLAILGLLGALLLGGGFGLDYYLRNAGEPAFLEASRKKTPKVEFSSYSLGGLLKIIQETKYSEHMQSASRQAIEIMKQKGYREILLGFNERVYQLGQEEIEETQLKSHLSSPIICHKDSPFLSKFYEQLGRNKALVKDNVDWFVFTPNLIAEINGSQVEEAGLSTGNRIIFIDTKAGDDIRDPIEYPAIFSHEASHEALSSKNTPLLINEKIAHTKQKQTAEDQLKTQSSKTLEGMVNACTQRIQTADYLSQGSFDPDFNNVYPQTVIVAGSLLNAGINQSILEKYTKIDTNNTQLDLELSTAAGIAKIPHIYNLKKATDILYSITEKGSDLEKKNAASALQFLHPDQLQTRSSSCWDTGKERDIGFSFGKSSGEGKDHGGNGISGLPSLGTLLNDSRIRGRSLFSRLFSEEAQPQYKDIQGGNDVSSLSEEAKHRKKYLQEQVASASERNYQDLEIKINKMLPDFPGDPDEEDDWTYKGYRADRFGKTIVVFQSNSVSIKNPFPNGISATLYMTKQDTYQYGEFVRTFWNFVDELADRDYTLDPPIFYKKVTE